MSDPDKRSVGSHHHSAPLLVANHRRPLSGWFWLLPLMCVAANVFAADIKLVKSRPNQVYGVPRPGFDQPAVPLRTSFYLELAVARRADDDVVLRESVAVRLTPAGHAACSILGEDVQFGPGYHGFLRSVTDRRTGPKLVVYIDSDLELLPETAYTIQVAARSRDGAELPPDAGKWQFTTETRPTTAPVNFALQLDAPAVRWHGGFFTGFCGVTFGGNQDSRMSTFELMDEVRRTAPRAWSLQRDFWLTGMEHQPQLMAVLPNIVRERETRRIVGIDRLATGTVLKVEDFYGHQQYGIPGGQPPSGDYRAGDEVLIADGVHDARAKVVAVDDAAGTVTVTDIATPDEGWKLAYSGSISEAENPNAPGLFPHGGTYLRKFSPCGVPVYYWGRLDHEWDLAHRRFGRRLIVNFADAPGDLSIDGRNWTTAKDYVQLHQVVGTITGHIIDRYGKATLSFPWSVFNEPNLGLQFWRSDWKELQKFYDYTTDAILRAFEDRGYDSESVFIGGLELAGASASENRLREFLAHCSPQAEAPGALPLNAAFADPRLDGKRSARVTKLCGDHGGRGAPCDFISVHAYKPSQAMAAEIISAKETALEMDPKFYSELWVNSHESCPGWQPLPDPAFGDSYLGNGYFVTWCADVARRQLRRAVPDGRFAFGESILTYWPRPVQNFDGANDFVREIHVDDDGDGQRDRSITVAMPILHFLGLLAQMGDEYHVLPEQVIGGHVVSGFASRTGDTVRLLLYSHSGLDTESRSDADFEVSVDLSGLDAQPVSVREYRFDKDHNSYFHLGRSLRDLQDVEGLDAAIRLLQSDSIEKQLDGLERLSRFGTKAKAAIGSIYQCLLKTQDNRLSAAAIAAIQRISAPQAYPADVVREVERRSHLRETGSARHIMSENGTLQLQARVSGNGANYLVIEPAS